jgi:hypothetical protein
MPGLEAEDIAKRANNLRVEFSLVLMDAMHQIAGGLARPGFACAPLQMTLLYVRQLRVGAQMPISNALEVCKARELLQLRISVRDDFVIGLGNYAESECGQLSASQVMLIRK